MVNHNPDYNILPVSDPRWREETEPLLRYVRAQRSVTIDDIVIWGRGARHPGNKIKNMLAWLSFNNLVAYDVQISAWRIVSCEQSEKEKDEAV